MRNNAFGAKDHDDSDVPREKNLQGLVKRVNPLALLNGAHHVGQQCIPKATLRGTFTSYHVIMMGHSDGVRERSSIPHVQASPRRK
jgi:hypothetical protein